MSALTRCVVTPLALLMLGVNGWDFEKQDLETQKRRRAFFKKGPYAVGLMKAALGEMSKVRGTTPLVYFTSESAYDCIYSFDLPAPIEIGEQADRIAFTSKGKSYEAERTLRLVISAHDGVTLSEHYEFPADGDGLPLSYVKLSTARFLDADIFQMKDEEIDRMTFNGHTATVDSVTERFDQETIRTMFTPQRGFAPNWVMRTEEGLRVIWQISLETEGVSGTYAPHARLLAPGPGGNHSKFYNALSSFTKGGKAHFEFKLRVAPEDGFPRKIKPTASTTLFDTHAHITARTDLRDSALMACKLGY